MVEDPINEAAALLAESRLSKKPFDGLPLACRPDDEAAAYAVQDALHLTMASRGLGQMAGHKIGCTTKVMQRYLGIHNPCAGGILAETIAYEHGDFRHRDFVRVGVECEIAVSLGRDLSADAGPHSRTGVGAAVSACMAAIEIVDDRYVDYSKLDTPTLIADDFFNAGAVLGSPVTAWQALDLAAIEGRMTVNGEVFGPGRGADILGHPFEALAWLANEQNARGRSLRAGEIVLLGSVVQTRWLNPGDKIEIAIDGLGEVAATFA